MTLSGGMKRRVLIAKALSHEPEILFLDEPTAGVDVELRRDMWDLVRGLRDTGVTIILTTHYIEEAEEMADRIGIIDKGELILVEEKAELMRKLGKKQLTLQSAGSRSRRCPTALAALPADAQGRRQRNRSTPTIPRASAPASLRCCSDLSKAGIRFSDLQTTQSSLEDIFVDLVRSDRNELRRGLGHLHASRWRAQCARCCRASSRR